MWIFQNVKHELPNHGFTLPSNFSNFFKVMEYKSTDLNTFISTLWYDNVDDYDFLKLIDVLPLKIYLG
jgi:hypothetical protein